LTYSTSLASIGNSKEQFNTEQNELADLKKELANVKMEPDILKKAVSIFSVGDRKSTNS